MDHVKFTCARMNSKDGAGLFLSVQFYPTEAALLEVVDWAEGQAVAMGLPLAVMVAHRA